MELADRLRATLLRVFAADVSRAHVGQIGIMEETAGKKVSVSSPENKKRNIEAIYPLRLTQQAMMLFADSDSDPGFLQVHFTLSGAVDENRLREAWCAVLHRHAGLRMSVHHAAGQAPMIVVWRAVEAPWALFDWRELDEQAQSRQLAAWADEDRQRGLDLSAIPVMRWTVVRTGDQRYRVIWTCHHLFVDGWSSAIVIEDLLKVYHNLGSTDPSSLNPPSCSYRDYMTWLKRRDELETKAFWQQVLKDLPDLPALRLRSADEVPLAPDVANATGATVSIMIDEPSSRRLRAACMSSRITPNTLIQGAWAILLAVLNQTDDAVFGATVAGRPAELEGIDRLVAFLSNTVPVRVRLSGEQTLATWLGRLRDDQAEARLYEYVDLSNIQAWLDRPGSRPLFESLLVVENFPWKQKAPESGLRLSDFSSGLTSNYALTISVVPSGAWSIACVYDQGRFPEPAIHSLLALAEALLCKMASDPDVPLFLVLDWLQAEASSHFVLGQGYEGEQQYAAAYVAPRNEAELRMAEIWEEILGVSPVGIEENFFELGGTSISAVRLFAAIESQFGKKLPLAILLERPSVGQLAEAITSETQSPWRCLLPLRPEGERPPLFCVHAGGDHALYYRHLAKRLPAAQPVYGLQSPGLDGEQLPLNTIEEIAACYVDEILAVQPCGPYYLLGYCMGACVALEMTREIERRGDKVAQLLILDSGFFWGEKMQPERLPAVREASGLMAKVIRIVREQGVLFLGQLFLRNLGLLFMPHYRAMTTLLRLKLSSPEERRRMGRDLVERTTYRAFQGYTPRRCNAAVQLLRTSESVEDAQKERHMVWRELTPSLSIHVIPGEHRTILLEPGVKRAAAAVDTCLKGDVDR
jgi:thioesterase domain-containing protein/acyl carrier protein